MPVQEKFGDGTATGKEVNEKLSFRIPMVTSSCWLKISVRDLCNAIRSAASPSGIQVSVTRFSTERSQADFAPSPPLAMSAKRTQRQKNLTQSRKVAKG